MEQRIALTLWYLATNADYCTTGHLFSVLKATVCIVTKEVCNAIVKVLLSRHIQVLTRDELKNVMEGFRNELGFPQCAGVVDGSHIPIIHCISRRVSGRLSQRFPSIIKQGMVDNRGH